MLKANSYDNLFGSPAPMERSRPRERRFTRQDREPTDRRSRRMPAKRSPGGNHS